ncbi:MFS transporter [Labedaea rhizosphaerae]|uniref:EmrB/QacA subfamily drug resistance transporter n=1 Tax=Labedaea rhizosphaerae TaxID=598644 RepID=A0A4R6SLT5_LABRH|nr:MFS transporter [Labedaea rhizosphaerae]TDQ04821.1 EmrB/QacA subfamily drug resistance transporter [Labedaea rhizosphaerae]
MTSTARRQGTGLVLALVCASQFMVILDASIVNVALPSIQHELGFTDAGLAWVVNGYLLTFAGFMLLGGRAADLFGHRRVLVGGLALFAASSLVAGLAGAPQVLVEARVAQGIGAAMLAPATLAVINTTFVEDRARAFGAWSAAGGVGGMAGAIVGGAMTTALSWRSVFLINVPIGAALIVIAVVSLVATQPGRRHSLDVAGAVTGTAGLAAVIYGVMANGWFVGVGVVLLVAFVVVQGRFATEPMMPLRLFRLRGVAVGSGMLVLFGGIAMAMWYFTSLYLQNVLHYDAFHAGLGQTPAAVTFVLVARWAPRIGAKALLWLGAACFLAGFGWLAQADAASGYAGGVLGPTLLVAAGIGLVFPTLMAVATAGVPEGDAGVAGGIANTASQAGASIGLAVLTTIAGYDHVFLVAAGLGLAIAVVSLLLRRQ